MISVFLDPHPEEILYSAVARNTSSLNYLDLRSVGVTYFSDPHTIATVVLPCRLEYPEWEKVVRQTAEEIRESSNFPVKVTRKLLLAQLGQPVLFNRSNVAFDSLPLTSCALDEAVETSTAFIWRKLRWTVRSYLIEQAVPSYNDFLKRVHINSTTSNRPTIKQLAKIAYSSLRAGTVLGEQIPEKCLEHQEEVVAVPEIRAAITSRSLASAFFNKQMILPNEEACQGRLTYDPFSILLLTVAAVVNGAESVYSVAHWGYQNEDLLHWFGFPKGRFPAYDTLQRTYAILDINSFESILKTWLSETFPPVSE